MEAGQDPSTPRASHSHLRSDALPSSARTFSGGHISDGHFGDEDQDPLSKYIWGTNVSVNEVKIMFGEFLEGFKPKYRADYNRKVSQEIVDAGGIAPLPVPFYENLTPEQANTPLYEGYLKQMYETDQDCLNVDLLNILSWPRSKKLYHQCLNFPQEVIPALDIVLMGRMVEMVQDKLREKQNDFEAGLISEAAFRKEEQETKEYLENKQWHVRTFGGERTINMRELNPGDTDKLVAVKGLVIRATPVIPEMESAFFRCSVCQHTLVSDIDRGRIQEPNRCPREACNTLGSMVLIHNRSQFMNKQVVRLQETPDAVPDGQTPHTVSICVYDELVDLVKPGDRVIVTGIFRSIPVRVNPRQRSIKSLFKTYVDTVHIKRTNMGRMGYDPSTRDDKVRPPGMGVGGEDDEQEILQGTTSADMLDSEVEDLNLSATAAMEQKLLELSRHPDIYDMLARSMAPSIYEMEDVKKGILLQLFGGTNKSIARGGGGGGPRYRGDINVLMVGDPGTSKSQILQVSMIKVGPD